MLRQLDPICKTLLQQSECRDKVNIATAAALPKVLKEVKKKSGAWSARLASYDGLGVQVIMAMKSVAAKTSKDKKETAKDYQKLVVCIAVWAHAW